MQGYQVRGIGPQNALAGAGAPPQQPQPQKRKPLANALSFMAQVVAPEAYEQGRQRKASRQIGNALAGGNYGQAAQTAYQYGNVGQGLQLAQYEQQMQAQQQQAQIEAQKRAQQQQIFSRLTPEQQIAAMYNPEAFGENYASNFGAQVVDQGQTFVRDAAGLGNVSVAPEAKVVGAGEVLAGQGGQILAQGPEAQPDLPTGMIMGPNGPQYVDGYLEGQERLRAAGRAQTNVTVGGQEQPTVFQKKLDEKAADEYIDWQRNGADSMAQISTIRDVVSKIDAGQNISGLDVGLTPDLLKFVTNPGAVAAREDVENVVQRNLRVVLGAQFTEKEGERLIKRAFNPNLDEGVNRKRLVRLMTQMEIAAQQKQAMFDHLRTNGTMRGYNGNVPSMQDFFAVMNEESGGANSPLTAAEQSELEQLRAELGGG